MLLLPLFLLVRQKNF
ncbi:MAG: hypothetical protein RMX68_002990 [Aulosira sp. ZfuVER01]